jgi:protein CpxP
MMDKTFGMIVLGILLSIAILVGITAVNPALANEYGRSGKHHIRPDFMKMLKQLDLSEDQRAQVKAVVKNFKNEMKPQRQSVREARIQILQEMLSDQFSESKMRTLIRNVSTLKEELIITQIKMVGEIKNLLTPEQVEKFMELKENRLTKIKERLETRKEGSNSWH